jgi:hypothetical protein
MQAIATRMGNKRRSSSTTDHAATRKGPNQKTGKCGLNGSVSVIRPSPTSSSPSQTPTASTAERPERRLAMTSEAMIATAFMTAIDALSAQYVPPSKR